MARVRSPNYPALSLPDAIEKIREVYDKQRLTPEPKEVVIKHMGYSGVNGRSLKALSALLKYGFLESDADSIKVSRRALDIIVPESDRAAEEAVIAAARSPKIYRQIMEKWEMKPTDDSLDAFLVREGFSGAAVNNIIRSYGETFDFVGHNPIRSSDETALADGLFGAASENESPNENSEGFPNSNEPVELERSNSQVHRPDSSEKVENSQPSSTLRLNDTNPIFNFETVVLRTVIDNSEDLEILIQRLGQIKPLLKASDR